MDAPQAIGFASFLAQTDAVGKSILAVLLVMSIATWYLIATKAIRLWVESRKSAVFLDAFWNAASIPAVEKYIGEAHPEEPFSHLAWHAITASRHHLRHGANKLDEAGSTAEFLTRAMRRVIDEDTARLESGLTVLASVGSTAPFVGLFGTVWGVYHALVNIGLSGQGTLDKVAGPVGEALIMTALGLAVAIPAVLAYNGFVRANRLVLAQLDSFAHDLYSVLVTGAHVGERGTVVPVKSALAAAGAKGN
ncbi:MAG TPA: MotA/TolQ/ExbB proton channel family protein [Burkholderiales bacterium]|nr:MotA/TolQ/ExbB proton channel family protein [Burkholderiales bacterium]